MKTKLALIAVVVCGLVMAGIYFVSNYITGEIDFIETESSKLGKTTEEYLTGKELVNLIRTTSVKDSPITVDDHSYGYQVIIDKEAVGACAPNALEGELGAETRISTTMVSKPGTSHYINPLDKYETIIVCKGKKEIAKIYRKS